MEKENWFNKSVEETVKKLNTNNTLGLTAEEVEKRKQKYGLNELEKGKKTPLIVKFLEQFKDFMIIVLIIAAVVSGIVGHINGEGITDSIIIMVVVIVNAIIGVAQEDKAEKSLEALKKLSSYSAKVIRNGKIVPLLELGAGFDKNYTGRENIFLYGAVLGYGRQYMEEKYDQIVEFSGLEDFMDVPIKNYSSGMKSKLGFAIATIAEPEILILDEVLSVGDGKFRKKSEKKILDMMQDGTAVLFVSHSLAQVKRICNKAMILEGGKMIAFGDVDEVAQVYAEMTGELDELTVGQKNLVKKKNKKKKTEKIKQEDKREVMEES